MFPRQVWIDLEVEILRTSWSDALRRTTSL
jgi:hypothetical protein